MRLRVAFALATAILTAASALLSCDLSYLGPGCSSSSCTDASRGPDSTIPDAVADRPTKPDADAGPDAPTRPDAAADAPTGPDADAGADSPTSTDAGSYASTIAEAGPIAWYRFEEPSGATAIVDSSGNGHDGKYHPGVALGKPGIGGSRCAYFNGNGYALVPRDDAGVLDFAGTRRFSTEIWVQPTIPASDAGGETLFAKETNDGGSGDNGYDLYLDPANNAPAFQREQGPVQDNVETVTALVVDAWSHIVVTYDGATLVLYLNGVNVTQASTTAVIPSTGVALAIASDIPDAPGGDYTGYLDELALYDRALSSAEVQNHYTLGKP